MDSYQKKVWYVLVSFPYSNLFFELLLKVNNFTYMVFSKRKFSWLNYKSKSWLHSLDFSFHTYDFNKLLNYLIMYALHITLGFFLDLQIIVFIKLRIFCYSVVIFLDIILCKNSHRRTDNLLKVNLI